MYKDNTFEYIWDLYCKAYTPSNDQPIYEWARDAGIQLDSSSPISGVYKIENSLWLAEPFHAFQDESVRMVTTIACNQGGRTKAQEIASLWSILHRPGPMQYNSDTDKAAKNFAENRWWQMALSCEAVRNKLPSGGTGLGKNRHKERTCKVIFTDAMPFIMQGCSDSNLQHDSIMTQFNDECFNWPVGQLEDAWIRCNVAYAWNYKVWNGSVAGIEDDDIHTTYKSGTQEEWHWHCLNPKCRKPQIPKWGSNPKEKGGIKFKRILFPNGDYDYEAIKKTVYYECEHCGFKFEDKNRVRKLLNKDGEYISMNPNAAPWHRSFRFNILTVNWAGLSWGKWVEEFLKATESWRKTHNFEPLKLFWSRRMSEPWEENKFLNYTKRIVVSDYKLGSPNYYIGKKWNEEITRFMGVDRQEKDFPAVIRAVGATGKSRLVYRGVLDSFNEIEAKAKEFDVHPKSVLLDISFEMDDCCKEIIRRGWTGMRGVDRENLFRHKLVTQDSRGQEKIIWLELPYSEEKHRDANMGTKQQIVNSRVPQRIQLINTARYFDWINLHIKNMLNGFKQGEATYWGFPEDVGSEYIKQINSEVKHRVINAKGKITYWWSNRNAKGGGKARPNHYWDCECMILTAMSMQKLIDLSSWNPEATPENELDKRTA